MRCGLVVFPFVLGLLAGCGEDSPDAGTQPVDAEDDAAKASAALLTPADLPDGWKVVAADAGDEDGVGATTPVQAARRTLSGVGDEAVSIRAQASFAGPEGNVPVVFEIAGVRKGRVLVSVVATTMSAPLAEPALVSLLQTMVART